MRIRTAALAVLAFVGMMLAGGTADAAAQGNALVGGKPVPATATKAAPLPVVCTVDNVTAPFRVGGIVRYQSSVQCDGAVARIEYQVAMVDSNGRFFINPRTPIPGPTTGGGTIPLDVPCLNGSYTGGISVFVQFLSGFPPAASGTFTSPTANITC